MPKIKILSREVSELIASGEVIDRPAAVIKELVENSIDSGAKHITVEIKNGGVTFIRVTDDGCGMSFEDVPTAFLRHATSKVDTKADLDNINTLGFRGEALASVSAVSRVEVLTKLREDTYGVKYVIEGSSEVLHEKVGCPDGTTIIIRDLFYNVPTRRKFLKKDAAEANAVAQTVKRITMSHPDIAFKFMRDNRLEFNSSGDGDLYSSVYAVYGHEFVHDLLPLDYEYKGVKISGYTVKPLYAKNSRAFQNFFVNGRYVRSMVCTSAIETAFTNLLMKGKYPACVVMIDIPPVLMDVNIHPTKSEVRFADEKTVSDAIYFAVKNALDNNKLLYDFKLQRHSYEWEKHVSEEEEYTQKEFLFTPVDKIEEQEQKLAEAEASANLNERTSEPAVEKAPEAANEIMHEELSEAADVTEAAPVPEVFPAEPVAEENPEPVSEPVEGFRFINSRSFESREEAVKIQEKTVPEKVSEWTEKPKIRVIGEAFGVYIIAETDDKKLVMIDKHAAHERIIFEQLKSRNCRQYSQMLMHGVKVLVTDDELSALETNTELLADMGFVFDFSERPCVIATAVPTFIMELDMEEIICEIAENLRMHSQSPQSHVLDDMLHTVACKSAIRGNDKNDITELQKLAEEVYSNEAIRHCPHGRPVIFTMTRSSIERQFGRT